MTAKRHYTVNEIAKLWGKHPETIRKMFRRGDFPRAMKTTPGRSGRILIPAKTLEHKEMEMICNAS